MLGFKHLNPEKLGKSSFFCIKIVAIFWISSNSETKHRNTMAQAASEPGYGITERMGHGEVVPGLDA